eukprot:TRINITY_DN2216_c0_g1_i1.p1 TRINITY_DN2216_c0_g1~~TRINITY_DN2216_c0_g1_i1.p1  ORF type:complete len:461 (-),score=79.68 TRINITY_DN2216_c0_g1_i1:31-1413(-)
MSNFVELDEDAAEVKEINGLQEVDLVQTGLPKKRFWQLTPEERLFWIEMSIILLVLFVAESSRGLVVPTLYLYVETVGGGKRVLGMVIAGYSVGRLFGSSLFGWLYNTKGGRFALVVSCAIAVLGNFFYSLAPLFGVWSIIVSRALVGLGSGVFSVARAMIADCTKVEERTRFMAYSSAVQFIGFALMPGAALIFLYIDIPITATYELDEYTLPGYVLALMNAIIVPIVMFKLPYRAPTPESTTKKSDSSVPEEIITLGIWVFIFLNFVARGTLAVLETTGAPVFASAWGKTNDIVMDTSIMMLILGLIGLIVFFVIDKVEKRIPELYLLTFSFIIVAVGGMLMIDYGPGVNLAQFLSGALLIWSLGSPISQTFTLSTFSRILGSKPQGTLMGWIGSAGSVGRIVFPILAGFGGINVSFIISVIVSLLSAGMVLAYNWRVQVIKRRMTLDVELPQMGTKF